MKTNILYVGLVLAAAALATLCPEANPQVKKDNLPRKGTVQFKVPSVWSGTYQPPGGDPYPMVVYVVERNNRQFTAKTWYPTFNALMSASGEVDLEGNVTFTEEELIYSKAGSTVSAGAKYVGMTDGKVWNAVWDYSAGKGKFQLTLAETKGHEKTPGAAMADEFGAFIQKVEGDKITFFKAANTTAPPVLTLTAAKDVKVVYLKVTGAGKEAKAELGDKVEGGLKNKMFEQIRNPDVPVTLVTDKDGKVAEVKVLFRTPRVKPKEPKEKDT